MKKKTKVFFYEHEFYVLSNFSSFAIWWKGCLYPTSEHAYHSEKFESYSMKEKMRNAPSAHDAFKSALAHKESYRPDWDLVKLAVMKDVLREKALQHPYVMKKLLETGDRELVEDSWRDGFWGWGSAKDGQNHMGKLWMEVRKEFLAEKSKQSKK